MKAKAFALNGTDDCFARFDEAFAKLEADLVGPERRPATPGQDLSEYEEALDNIDRQLEAPSELAQAAASTPDASDLPSAPDAPSAPRTTLALVPPVAAAIADAPRSAIEPSETEPLWECPAGGTPLERLVVTMQNLLWLQRAIHSRGGRVADRVGWDQLTAVFDEVRRLCGDFDLQTARVRADYALRALDDDRLDLLSVEIGELVRHIRHDLQACSIVPIARDRVWGFSLVLDEPAQKAFPSAISDVADAGRCIGLGMHRAAAFHLLRAAECGRRAIARATRFDERDPEAPDWSATITALQTRMTDLAGWPAGPTRKGVKSFLTALVSDAKELEEARRRLAEGEPFAECHATALWYATRDFLTLAAERVSESDHTLLAPDAFIPRP